MWGAAGVAAVLFEEVVNTYLGTADSSPWRVTPHGTHNIHSCTCMPLLLMMFCTLCTHLLLSCRSS
jgi:hypothetical protein